LSKGARGKEANRAGRWGQREEERREDKGEGSDQASGQSRVKRCAGTRNRCEHASPELGGQTGSILGGAGAKHLHAGEEGSHGGCRRGGGDGGERAEVLAGSLGGERRGVERARGREGGNVVGEGRWQRADGG
jgi:hypothetical protein